MALRFIKDIPLLFIKNSFRFTEHAHFIAVVSSRCLNCLAPLLHTQRRMLESRYEKGLQFEESARRWFENSQEAQFVESRFRCRVGEIDLIFFIPSVRELVFVEVRGRTRAEWGKAFESITTQKLNRLKSAIRSYFWHSPRVKQLGARSIRLDILSWDQGVWTHLPNVWMD